MVIDPTPFLSNDCDLSKPESCIGLSHRSLDSNATSAQLPFLRLELHLTSDPHALEPTRALYLEGKEIKWFAALWQRRQNDFIGAATCFSLAEEPLPAAECYRLAALSLEQ